MYSFNSGRDGRLLNNTMLRLWQAQHLLCLALPPAAAAINCRLYEFHSLVVSLQKRGRTPAVPQLSVNTEEDSDGIVEKKSKGQKKREAVRAVDWAVQLSLLTNSQLRQAIRWGGLQEQVFDAVTLVKKIGRDGKNGRRRQLNLIGGMLRGVDSDLMEAVLKATKDGDVNGLFSKPCRNINPVEDGDLFYEEEPEREDHVKDKADQWLQGLLSGDPKVSSEVYSLRYADFDRQELRRLVKDVLQTENDDSLNENAGNEADLQEIPARTMPLPRRSLDERKRALRLFLEDLVVKISEN